MKKIAALLMTLSMLLMGGCAGVNLNFTGVSPFRNIRDTDKIAAIDKTVDDYMASSEAEAISVGVINGKETRFVSRGEDMNEHTVLPIGKMTTMFAGMLVSNFEYNTWLGHGESVSDWIKSPAALPRPDGQDIKVWQLVCGLSGLGDADVGDKDYYTAGMMYNQLARGDFYFDSGSQDYESSLGYALLTECLRQSYNMNANFVNLINNQVIVKMDLRSSAFARGDALAVYDGYESTAYDLLKVVGYCGGMLEYDVALSETIKGALTEVWSGDGQNLSLSFEIDKTGENAIYYKSGNADGVSSYIAFIPDLGVGVSILAKGDLELSALAGLLLEQVR